MSDDVGLPSSWCKVRISDVADVNPKGLVSGLLPADDDEVHFVPMSAVAPEFGGIDVSQRRAFAEVRKGYTQFSENDVLLAKITPCMENGKLAIVPELPARVGFGSTEFHVLRSGDAVQPGWLALYLSQQAFRKAARQNMTGSAGQLRVSTGWLSSAELPLPPAAEQIRIVAKLEELLSDLDAGVAELKAAQVKLQHYRQSLIRAAVEGSLTQTWREANPAPEETGADLLARILRERRARWEAQQLAKFEAQGKQPPKGWQAKYAEPAKPVLDAAPAPPSGWVWVTVGQLLAGLTSGSRDWAPYYDRGSCVFVMAQNVRPWRPNFAFRQLVDPPENDRDRARSQIAKDDLLVTIVGANTGQSCRVPEALEQYFVCQSVALLRPVDPSMSEFLNAVLNSEGHGQRQFREMNYGAGRPHLSFEQIESVLVPLPPLAEQVEILACLTEKLAAIDAQEMQLQRLHDLATAQRQNLLRAAFAGQLVPQDPADEPAAELLARIRAGRAAHGAAKKPRSKPAHGANGRNSVKTIPVEAAE